MSTGERIPRDKANALANGVIVWLESHCEQIEIVGSIRREKATVGDIEIVCRPGNIYQFNSTLNTLIKDGHIKKKHYPSGKIGSGKTVTRWGERMKSMVIYGVTCELFIADNDNYGYIKWLRTGPGDANQYVVSRMKRERSFMRFKDGYGWICSYQGDAVSYDTKLHLPDEEAVFHALGMGNVIPPKFRHEKVYGERWKGVLPGYLLDKLKADEPKQRKLF